MSILDPKSGEFEFRPGPIFANLVLADEINRTPPRTQSALLEAMNDGQVSVDGRTYPLERAVPGDGDAERRGALRHLPAARVADGPLPAAHPHRLPVARGRAAHPARIAGAPRGRAGAPRAGAVASPRCARCRRPPSASTCRAELADYIVAVARETRRSPHLALGVSPRGQLAWRNAARAAALADGRDYVLPDDLKSLAGPVLAHRVVPASPVEALARSRSDVERVLADILDRLPAPG